MRRRAAGNTTRIALIRAMGADVARADRFPLRFGPVLLLISCLVFASEAPAEPVGARSAPDVVPVAAPAARVPSASPPAALAIDSAPGVPLEDATGPPLAELLVLRARGGSEFRPQTADEVLTVAVARGPTPELEPKKPFRKRSLDLFRTERRVEIGNSEMLVRLRLRAKRRETMSVELRF